MLMNLYPQYNFWSFPNAAETCACIFLAHVPAGLLGRKLLVSMIQAASLVCSILLTDIIWDVAQYTYIDVHVEPSYQGMSRVMCALFSNRFR